MRKILILFLFCLHSLIYPKDHKTSPLSQFLFSDMIMTELGDKIWYNESNYQPDRIDLMTFWNKTEPFPSIGIAHFIWPPSTYKGTFSSGRFHLVIEFLHKNDANVPKWLLNQRYCPWETREKFYAAMDSKKMNELQHFLCETKAIQAKYLLERLKKFYLELVQQHETQAVKVFNKVLNTANGPYILVDYINFKHEGTNPKERYNGKGWGLLQVLKNINGAQLIVSPEKAFVDSARYCLMRRMRNSKNPKFERSWLPNWFDRLDSYLKLTNF